LCRRYAGTKGKDKEVRLGKEALQQAKARLAVALKRNK
jgi:hypothetical protein